jgi:hypothetical protein
MILILTKVNIAFLKGFIFKVCIAIFGALMAILPMSLTAQELQITKTDSSDFPKIKLELNYKGKSKFEADKLSISQLKKELPYTLQEKALPPQKGNGKVVYILLENSGNTNGQRFAEMRNGILLSIDRLEEDEPLNIGTFNSLEVDSMGVIQLNERFTTNHNSLKSQLIGQVQPVEDSLQRVDLYMSIVEGLEYVGSQPNITQDKLFIVVTTGKNNSESAVTSAECIAKSKDLGIPIYSITYLGNDTIYQSGMMTRIASRTGGRNMQVRTDTEVSNAIAEFLHDPTQKPLIESAYDLLFEVQPSQNGLSESVTIDINYKGARQIIRLSPPQTSELIPREYIRYLIISVSILGLIVIIMIIFNLVTRKRAKNAAVTEVEQAPVSPMVKAPVQQMTESSTLKKGLPESELKRNVPLLLINHEGRTESITLKEGTTRIGRHEINDIQLQEALVSGKHAIIEMNDEEIKLTDLGSTNGTFVNNERIRTCVLKHGDKIKLGSAELTLKI